jgi:hypothetical protein
VFRGCFPKPLDHYADMILAPVRPEVVHHLCVQLACSAWVLGGESKESYESRQFGALYDVRRM